VRGGPFQAEIDAGAFASDTRLKAVLGAAAGPIDPIYRGKASHLGPAIKALSDPESIGTVFRYERTGWTSHGFLISGRELPGIEVCIDGRLPYSFISEADLAKGLEALEALAISLDAAAVLPLIVFVFQAPLAYLLGLRNERYTFFVRGRTGSLKTTFTQALMALYGPGFVRDELLIKFGDGATPNAIVALAATASDLPILFDNFKPITTDRSVLISLIHNLLEGGEKDRLTSSAKLRRHKPLNCWPIMTGEDVPDLDPATQARVLVTEFRWEGGKVNEPLRRAHGLSPNLCAVGNTWVAWLEGAEGKKAAQVGREVFESRRSFWIGELAARSPNSANTLRVASNLASNEAAWAVMSEHPLLHDFTQRHAKAYAEGMGQIAGTMAELTVVTLEAVRFIDGLRQLLASAQAVLTPRNTVGVHSSAHIGWRDANGDALLLPRVARKKVGGFLGEEALGRLSDRTLYSQLRELGVIVPGTNTTTRAVRIDGQVRRVLHVKAEALVEPEDIDT
jgi:hypothetical protein